MLWITLMWWTPKHNSSDNLLGCSKDKYSFQCSIYSIMILAMLYIYCYSLLTLFGGTMPTLYHIMYLKKPALYREKCDWSRKVDLIYGCCGSRSEACRGCTRGALLCQTNQTGRGSPPVLYSAHPWVTAPPPPKDP